jgi:hypothetical protein
MAQGDLLLFNEYSLEVSSGTHNLAAAGDVIKVALITTLPVITQTTPTLADFTEVTGTGYTAGGVDIQTGQSLTVVSGPTYKYDSSVNPSWSQDGAGPTNIVAGLIYNSTTSNKAIGFIDMTVDGGTTPVSLQAGNVSITWNASGIFLTG